MPRLSYLVVILGLLAAFRAPAATFVVNSSNDVDDGACTTNHCSLREAIRASNSLFGADTILFNISPGGVQVITPLSALPPLTDAVNLDATSQPGYSGMPIIGLRGGAAGAANGLQVQAGSCTVKGLAIFSFALDGMVITGAGSSTIAGNFLGTDTGGAGMGNAGNGLQISNSPGNRIEDNILSDNGASGVLLTGGGAVGNAVVGNKIGTTASGGPLGNTLHGVLVQAGAAANLIGDTPAGDGNLIAYNGMAGVYVSSGSKNAIRHNSISSNANLGIDLGAMGVTANDYGDGDSGANMLQNFPLLRNPRQSGFFTLIDWREISTPFTTFTIEFFSSSACDPSTYGEGQRYLGQASSTTDATGYTPVVTTALPAVPTGYSITATATDPNGNTSELAHCELVP